MTSKKDLSERDICTKYIRPALEKAGSNLITQIREEVSFTDGRIYVKGNLSSRGKRKRALLVHEVFANNYNYMKSGIHLRQVINKLNEIDFNNSKNKHVFGQIYETFLSELQSAGTLGEFYTPRAITELLTELINPKPGEKVLDPACGTGGFFTCALEHLKAKAANVAEREAIGKNVTGWEYKPLPYLLGNTNLILHDINLPNIQYDDSLAKPLTEYRQKDRVDIILANPPFGGVVSNNNENNFPQTFRAKESADLFLILMIHLLKNGGRAAIVLPDGSLTGDGVKQRIRQKLPENYKSYSKTKPIQLSKFNNVKKWWNSREENEQAWQVDFETIRKNGYNLDIKNPHQPKPEKQSSSAELLDLLHHSFAKGDDLLAQLKKELS